MRSLLTVPVSVALALAVAAPATASPGPVLQQCARCGDGDSWKDAAGREYRLGLVNAPERQECFGPEATARRRALLRDGFRADVHQRDRYGRGVSVVLTAGGRTLDRVLAQEGLVDDRYLRRYRHEQPVLARQLDGDFAEAKLARRGLWGACR